MFCLFGLVWFLWWCGGSDGSCGSMLFYWSGAHQVGPMSPWYLLPSSWIASIFHYAVLLFVLNMVSKHAVLCLFILYNSSDGTWFLRFARQSITLAPDTSLQPSIFILLNNSYKEATFTVSSLACLFVCLFHNSGVSYCLVAFIFGDNWTSVGHLCPGRRWLSGFSSQWAVVHLLSWCPSSLLSSF